MAEIVTAVIGSTIILSAMVTDYLDAELRGCFCFAVVRFAFRIYESQVKEMFYKLMFVAYLTEKL